MHSKSRTQSPHIPCGDLHKLFFPLIWEISFSFTINVSAISWNKSPKIAYKLLWECKTPNPDNSSCERGTVFCLFWGTYKLPLLSKGNFFGKTHNQVGKSDQSTSWSQWLGGINFRPLLILWESDLLLICLPYLLLYGWKSTYFVRKGWHYPLFWFFISIR